MFSPALKVTPATVNVVVQVRNGFVQVGHQYVILTESENDTLMCFVYVP